MSADGTHWTDVVTGAAGTGQFTTIELPRRQVRRVRLTLTASAGN
ncbi:hypothetical protein [Streptomyces sp. NBC_00102]|nr:hypothetical protein [Streptomyces sp. NBC_00102]MCX5400438.1 hypothetical protein [Streptomyces sp. NBC_00102]